MMNFSNCSIVECESSAVTKEAAEFYLEKVGINNSSVLIGQCASGIIPGRSSPGRVTGAPRQHGGHHGAQVGED